jgi:hypothetical protein
VTRYRILPTRSRVWIEARSNVHAIQTEAAGLEGCLDIDGRPEMRSRVERALEFPVANLKLTQRVSRTARCNGGSTAAVIRRSPATCG